jgi:nucleoid-associated protein YgaU
VQALLARAQAGVRARDRAGVRPVAPAQPHAVVKSSSGVAGPTYVAQPAVVRTIVATRSGRRAAPGDWVHVVVAGESLWSIANDVLGGRATVAQVAREVNRLWELNRARIGTGDRDLLPVGTRLELK